MKRLLSAQSNAAALHHPVDDLTRQERVVLAMLEEGLSTAEIVRRMGIGNSTVRSHIQAILTKLGVHSRVQAVAMVSHEPSWQQVNERGMSRRAEPGRTRAHRLVAPARSLGGGPGPLVAPQGRRRRGDGAHEPRLGARILQSGIDVLVVALWEADGFRPEDIRKMRQSAARPRGRGGERCHRHGAVGRHRPRGRPGMGHASASVDELMRVVHGVATAGRPGFLPTC